MSAKVRDRNKKEPQQVYRWKWQFLIVNGDLAICAIIFIIVCELGVFSREVSQL